MPDAVRFPESEPEHLLEYVRQLRWMATVSRNLDRLYQAAPDVMVAADPVLYPVEGDASVRRSPEVCVAFGRPKRGRHADYRVWEEGGVFPQVVFEVLSRDFPRPLQLERIAWYDRFGAEECYLLDPFRETVEGYCRRDGALAAVVPIDGWVSPRLGVRFTANADGFDLYAPDGSRFQPYADFGTPFEISLVREAAGWQRAARLAVKLRELGVDPDAV